MGTWGLLHDSGKTLRLALKGWGPGELAWNPTEGSGLDKCSRDLDRECLELSCVEFWTAEVEAEVGGFKQDDSQETGRLEWVSAGWLNKESLKMGLDFLVIEQALS